MHLTAGVSWVKTLDISFQLKCYIPIAQCYIHIEQCYIPIEQCYLWYIDTFDVKNQILQCTGENYLKMSVWMYPLFTFLWL